MVTVLYLIDTILVYLDGWLMYSHIYFVQFILTPLMIIICLVHVVILHLKHPDLDRVIVASYHCLNFHYLYLE